MAKAHLRIEKKHNPERSVAFDLRIDMRDVPKAVRDRLALPNVEIKIRGGSLLPEQARVLLDLLYETVKENA